MSDRAYIELAIADGRICLRWVRGPNDNQEISSVPLSAGWGLLAFLNLRQVGELHARQQGLLFIDRTRP